MRSVLDWSASLNGNNNNEQARFRIDLDTERSKHPHFYRLNLLNDGNRTSFFGTGRAERRYG